MFPEETFMGRSASADVSWEWTCAKVSSGTSISARAGRACKLRDVQPSPTAVSRQATLPAAVLWLVFPPAVMALVWFCAPNFAAAVGAGVVLCGVATLIVTRRGALAGWNMASLLALTCTTPFMLLCTIGALGAASLRSMSPNVLGNILIVVVVALLFAAYLRWV